MNEFVNNWNSLLYCFRIRRAIQVGISIPGFSNFVTSFLKIWRRIKCFTINEYQLAEWVLPIVFKKFAILTYLGWNHYRLFSSFTISKYVPHSNIEKHSEARAGFQLLKENSNYQKYFSHIFHLALTYWECGLSLHLLKDLVITRRSIFLQSIRIHLVLAY